LFSAASKCPNLFTAKSIKAVTSDIIRISVLRSVPDPPIAFTSWSLLISDSTFAPGCQLGLLSLAQQTTSAPLQSNSKEVAYSIPVDPPVTKTTLPFQLVSQAATRNNKLNNKYFLNLNYFIF
jgi:hypothetical protein